jgi:hypothetical protein
MSVRQILIIQAMRAALHYRMSTQNLLLPSKLIPQLADGLLFIFSSNFR